MDILQETITRYLPGTPRHTGKCIEIDCPCCIYMGESRNDTKGRGGVFIEFSTTGYHCFNCGFKFRQQHTEPLTKKVRKFLELLMVPTEEIQRVLFVYRKNLSEKDTLLSTINKPKKKISVDLSFTECDLPPGSHLLHDILDHVDSDHPASKAYAYAVSRGIDHHPYLIWSNSKANRLDEYLFIPFLFKDQVVGYQGRYFGDNEWHKENKRFLNKNPNSGKYLFGIDNIFSDQKYLIINESLIDSYLYHGVGLMRHEISLDQQNLINEFKGTKILVPDFGKGGQHLVDIAIRNEWNVYFPFWDDGRDLGEATDDYGRLFLLQDIIRNSTNNQTKIKIKRKML